jgi:hypothetical protein
MDTIFTDHLVNLPPPEVAAFYRRLAAFIQAKVGSDSLAATLLRHWLDGGGKDAKFSARYVRDLPEVRSYLRDTARPIFLSQRPTPSGTIGGVVPRIRGTIKVNPPGGPYPMHLEGGAEIPITVQGKAQLKMKVAPGELDAFYALHGFTMICDVVVSAAKLAGQRSYNVKFDRWICKVSDEYHWNPDKHIIVPNPDYGSKAAGAVAPQAESIMVYHSNAIRLEQAGLAKAFHDESEPWEEKSDLTVSGPAIVVV